MVPSPMVSFPDVAQSLKEFGVEDFSAVVHSYADHDEVEVRVDVENLHFDAQRVEAGMLGLIGPVVAGVVPVEMVAVVGGVVGG